MPITGKKRIELSKDTILERCSSYDIYRHFFGPFEINEVTCNHLRGDNNPSFIIGNKYGELRHKDFGSIIWKGDCINLVMQKYSCDFNTALKIIDKELNLGISQQKVDNLEVIKWQQPKESIIKPPPTIQITTRKPNKEELGYWEQYGITLDDLKRENVYFPKTIYRNKKKIPNTLLTFCYFYPEINKIKIYRPLAPKREKNTPPWLWKWDSNVPLNTVEGLNNLKKDKNTLICKSKKDYIVCKKIYPYTCNVQNESLAAFSEEAVEYINNNSNNVFYAGDSDKAGKEASYAITGAFGWKHINPPDFLFPNKDFADWRRMENDEVIRNHFINKKLYIL